MAKEPPTCPICGRRSAEAYKPFCTPRCQEVDLGRWLTGVYRVPGAAGRIGRRPATIAGSGLIPALAWATHPASLSIHWFGGGVPR